MHNPLDSGEKRLKCVQEYSFPDDLLINILITLSAKDVMRCRCVCKSWRHLTSAPYFLDLFFQNSIQVTLAHNYDQTIRGSKQFMFNNWWRPHSARSAISRFNSYPAYSIACSGDGLLVLQSERGSSTGFIVINPVYPNEKVTIFVPEGYFWSTKACAIYFHPTVKDYCILWTVVLDGRSRKYMVSRLGSKSCWREIENRWVDSVWFPNNIRAVLASHYIYWLVELGKGNWGIMEFGIISEEFKVVHFPRCGYDHNNYLHSQGYLLNFRGTLSFFLPMHWEDIILQWTLIDRALELWTITEYKISKDLHYSWFKVIAVVEEEILVDQSIEKRFLVINLKHGTTRELEDDYYDFWRFSPYVTSLVSLRNYQTKIRMKEKGGKDAGRRTILNSSLKVRLKKKRS